MIERVTGLAQLSSERWKLPRRALTLVFIMLSWAIFRARDGTAGVQFLSALAGFRSEWHLPSAMTRLLDAQTMLAFGIGMVACVWPGQMATAGLFLGGNHPLAGRARAASLLVLLPVVLAQVLASEYSPFLYFQF